MNMLESGADAVRELGASRLRVAVAESCTGGLLGGALTSAPGSSEVFRGGVIAYHDDIKQQMLGVPAKVLKGNGAVSAACVEAMAHGVRERFGTDLAVAISGIAGPAGGTLRKPVGTVWVAVLGPEHLMNAHKLKLKGDREEVRRQSVLEALRLLMGQVEEARLEGVV